MIVLDTHVLVFDALDPKRLSRAARAAIERGSAAGTLACSDISLWEIALLVARGRVSANTGAVRLLNDIVQARALRVLPISPRIAVLAQSDRFAHGDPADRIIAATALAHRAALVSSDARLRKLETVKVIWLPSAGHRFAHTGGRGRVRPPGQRFARAAGHRFAHTGGRERVRLESLAAGGVGVIFPSGGRVDIRHNDASRYARFPERGGRVRPWPGSGATAGILPVPAGAASPVAFAVFTPNRTGSALRGCLSAG